MHGVCEDLFLQGDGLVESARPLPADAGRLSRAVRVRAGWWLGPRDAAAAAENLFRTG